jgi:hypothetical protein
MICARAEILAFLGKGGSVTDQEDGLINLLSPMVEQSVKRFVGYSIEQATHTHFLPRDRRGGNVDPAVRYYDVQGGKAVGATIGGVAEAAMLLVPEIPLRSITNLYEDTSAYAGQGSSDFTASTELTSGSDFYVQYEPAGLSMGGIIHRTGGYWPAKNGTVKVVYVGGYTQAELSTGIAADIKLACLLSIQHAFGQRGESAGTIKAERLGDYAVTYAVERAAQMPRQARKLLGPFVSFGKFL